MATTVFKQSRFQHADMTGINITPLVDVLLVLLIIFMVQSLPSSKALTLALPGPTTDPMTTTQPRTLLTLDANGSIRMEGASIAPPDLKAELVALRARAPETTLALEASEGTDYGLFARVLADTRNAGFTDVALRQ